MVWVHEMAAYQVGKALKPGDNRCWVRVSISLLKTLSFIVLRTLQR
jgi:hypothetical protein